MHCEFSKANDVKRKVVESSFKVKHFVKSSQSNASLRGSQTCTFLTLIF